MGGPTEKKTILDRLGMGGKHNPLVQTVLDLMAAASLGLDPQTDVFAASLGKEAVAYKRAVKRILGFLPGSVEDIFTKARADPKNVSLYKRLLNQRLQLTQVGTGQNKWKGPVLSRPQKVQLLGMLLDDYAHKRKLPYPGPVEGVTPEPLVRAPGNPRAQEAPKTDLRKGREAREALGTKLLLEKTNRRKILSQLALFKESRGQEKKAALRRIAALIAGVGKDQKQVPASAGTVKGSKTMPRRLNKQDQLAAFLSLIMGHLRGVPPGMEGLGALNPGAAGGIGSMFRMPWEGSPGTLPWKGPPLMLPWEGSPDAGTSTREAYQSIPRPTPILPGGPQPPSGGGNIPRQGGGPGGIGSMLMLPLKGSPDAGTSTPSPETTTPPDWWKANKGKVKGVAGVAIAALLIAMLMNKLMSTPKSEETQANLAMGSTPAPGLMVERAMVPGQMAQNQMLYQTLMARMIGGMRPTAPYETNV